MLLTCLQLNQVYWDLSATAADKMKHAFDVLGQRVQAGMMRPPIPREKKSLFC